MKHLVIAGAGEFGRELFWSLQGSLGYGEEFDIKGYIDDDSDTEKISRLQKPYLGTVSEYEIAENDVFTCAIASPLAKEKVVGKLLEKGAVFISVIHKTAIIHGTVKFGQGIIVSPYSIIGDGSVVGDFFVMNALSTIGHDCVIGDYASVMSQCSIMGHTEIGEKAFIGGGAKLVPGVRIGSGSYVGAGSVVLRKVRAGDKVFGNPAVPI